MEGQRLRPVLPALFIPGRGGLQSPPGHLTSCTLYAQGATKLLQIRIGIHAGVSLCMVSVLRGAGRPWGRALPGPGAGRPVGLAGHSAGGRLTAQAGESGGHAGGGQGAKAEGQTGARRGQQETSFRLPMLVGARTAGHGVLQGVLDPAGGGHPASASPEHLETWGAATGGGEGPRVWDCPLPRRPLPPPPPLSGAHSVPWWGAPEDAWKGRSTDSTCGFPVR